MIACGWYHLLLLRQDGLVFTMGDNHWSQITGDEKSPYECMIHIDNLENVKLIVGGGLHSLSMTNKGEIYSWGSNGWGQLGLAADSYSIKDIVAGKYHSLFLFDNGQLWGCGSNYNGVLGLGEEIKQSKLTKITIKIRQLTRIPKKQQINLERIACSRDRHFSLAYDGSSYYAWGETNNSKWSSPMKLGKWHSSFASSSVVMDSPITFGLSNIID
nr:RCC1 and BTB domain-containing protein 1-like [Dermatophagoides farinae]